VAVPSAPELRDPAHHAPLYGPPPAAERFVRIQAAGLKSNRLVRLKGLMIRKRDDFYGGFWCISAISYGQDDFV
jgi:hypothetical protein